MASSTFTALQHQELLFSVPPCKLPSPLHPFNFHSSCQPLCSNHTQLQKTPYPRARFSAAITPKLSTRDPETSREAFVLGHAGETGSGVGSFASQDKSNGRNSVSPLSSIPRVGESSKKRSVNGATARKSRKKWFSWSRDETLVAKSSASVDSSVDKEVYERNEGGNGAMGKRRIGKLSKKVEALKPVGGLKYQLDKCAEKGRLMGAIELYEKALKDGMKMRPYYYTVLLDLCSFAAVGVIRPPKSWSGNQNPNMLTAPAEGLILNSNAMALNKAHNRNGSAKSPLPSDKKWTDSSVRHRSSDNSELTCTGRFDGLDDNFDEGKPALSSNGLLKPNTLSLDGIDHGEMNSRDNKCTSGERSSNQEKIEIQVTENFKNYALQKGFQIYEKMCLDEVPLNEATLTALARMAMSMGNGDMAFDAVKQIAGLGIKPTLRSYEPALSTYCNNGDIEKAFAVEKHMLDHGVCPEEPELEALLRVSIGASKADKVYYLLHKLRTTVRKVSPSTADVIVRWFESKASSRVGKRKVDQRLIREAIQNRGGGWHGKGWLGKGKWAVSRSTVGADALCKCCGEKLAFTDLDPVETEMFSESEKFAESVASMAIWREKNSNFLKFQKWLEDHGPFEVVIDGANVGYSDQRVFEPYKINAVVNEIRQSLPSRKWPLIVLNNKRITGHKLGKPVNRLYVHMWRNADALYTTPTGSNDDWYWLYAAIKFKCLLVTNDEMKDHMFQLLGNDFFPKWKERHQVHFSFPGTSPVLHMPPPCSVVIQESENGCWHIPIGSEEGYVSEMTWLCITRTRSDTRRQDSATLPEGVQLKHSAIPTVAQAEATMESPAKNGLNHEKQRRPTEEVHKSVRDIVSVIMSLDHRTTTLSKIEAAERNGGCVIDFQI